MAVEIPAAYLDLFDKPAFAGLATVMPDGHPQVTPVWVDYQDGLIVLNSAKGRVKDKNLRRDPRVALAIIDPGNPYRYLQVCGHVIDITEEGADDHINRMAKKYLDKDVYPFRQPGEVRVLYKISPDRVQGMGS